MKKIIVFYELTLKDAPKRPLQGVGGLSYKK